MMETDDKLIRSFFEENKKEIADRGFSRRVMRSLPRRKNRIFKALTIAIGIAAFGLFIAYDGLLGLIYIIRDLFIAIAQNSNLYTDPKSIIIAVVVLAVLGFSKICSLSD